MTAIRSVLITGANAGLGYEAARQLASRDEVTRVYLACRNEEKARIAKASLEQDIGRAVFEVVLMDVMDLESVRAAVDHLTEPVDAVVLNAGGMGGATPHAHTEDGVTRMFAVNVLGHAVLVDRMLERGLIRSVVLYAGSEAARGIPRMGVPRPVLESSTVDEFEAIANGAKFGPDGDPMVAYANVKLTAALWMAAMARAHPAVRFVTMSPGGTTGTNGMDDLPFLKKLLFKHVGGVLMPLFGMMHGVEVGARRYLDGLTNERFASGRFYASKGGSPTGPVVDQTPFFAALADPVLQDRALEAVHRFA